MLDAEQITFLASEAGVRALEQAARLPADRLTRLQRLRREFSVETAAAIVELLELRQRARAKFITADRMFFTSEGLEQSTGSVISAYRASRFPMGIPIMDACCGIGGDALALCRRAPVLAVESNPVVATCAQANVRALSAEVSVQTEPAAELNSVEANAAREQAVEEKTAEEKTAEEKTGPDSGINPVYVLCADVTTLDLARLRDRGIGAACFDPSRRIDTREGRKRARRAEDYLPPLAWLKALTAHFACVSVKVSPAIEDATLQELTQDGGVVEFLSDRGECKEAVLWFGSPAHDLPLGSHWHKPEETMAATVLRPGQPPATLAAYTREPLLSSLPRQWLYEPDPAVIRAHLVATLTDLLDLSPLDPQIAYLTGDAFISTPFATAYRVLDWMPFHLKNLQAWLKTHKRRVEVVKRRGVVQEPEEIRKKLASAALADYPPIVLVLTRRKEQTIAICCDLRAPANSSESS